ncbi:MAG TPA: glycosyl hydrolase family 28-related protein, partial [Balneolales bacterium]|nr:glycosyl hydrolase family 28-related protein [Balneolales bacterium]
MIRNNTSIMMFTNRTKHLNFIASFILGLSLIAIMGQGCATTKSSPNLQVKKTAPVLKSPQAKSVVYNVMDYGATGNGKTLDNKAIDLAIDAAAKAGGGTVVLPAGTYLSGTIHLKSNIALYLEQ